MADFFFYSSIILGIVTGVMFSKNKYEERKRARGLRRLAAHQNATQKANHYVSPIENYDPHFYSFAAAGAGVIVFALYVLMGGKVSMGHVILFFPLIAVGVALVTIGVGYAIINEYEKEGEITVPSEPPQFQDTNIEVREPTFEIPDELRLSHMLILGGTGSGKTSFLKELIAKDLGKPCSVVVFDSQGDLNNAVLKVDVPRERVVVIDPTDVGHPIALSLFDFKSKAETAYEREKHFNSVVELLLFVLASLDSQVTAKQELTLRMLIRLCLVIPDATIHTLLDLLTESGFKTHAAHVSKLGSTAQTFFNEYLGKGYQETREQIARRMYSILEVESLSRMFASPKSKIDMGELLDNGSVILINTAKAFLKEQGSAFFARFMTALIFQAIQERNPQARNTDVFMYIDEAAPVISEQTATILETARKYRLGLTLAFQSLGQVPADLSHSIISNTAIKAVSGISAKDARALAEDMHTRPETLMAVKRLSFHTYASGVGTHVFPVQFGALDARTQRKDLRQLIAENRERFAYRPEAKKAPSQDVSQSDIE